MRRFTSRCLLAGSLLPTFSLFLLTASPVHAVVTPTTPTTGGWTVLPYPPGSQSDYLLDQQTGTEEGDIVGEGGAGDLSGAYIAFNAGNTATNGNVGLRVRVGADLSPPGFKSEMHLGIDGNNDGTLDIFVSVDNSGVSSNVRIFKAGTGLNISPSTTTIDNTPLFSYSEVASNYDFEAVTSIIDPRVLTSTNTHPLDLDNQGNNDFFLSYFVPFADIVSAFNTVGITNITTNTLFRFVVASSTQPNSLNQDISGLNGGVNSGVEYTNTGGMTPPTSLDGQTNRAPNTILDLATTAEDTTVIIPVLANDVDPDGDTLSIASVTSTNGTVSISGTNVVFTPATNYNGTVTFTYVASDGHGGTNTGTVRVTVTPVNDAPVGVNDSYSVNEDTTLNVSAAGVLSNDIDVDGNALTAILVSGPSNGTLTLNTNGSFSYTPSTNFNGTDTFTYRPNDGLLNGNTATVTITVNPVNDAPVAVNDNYAVSEDATLNISAPGVLANDTDIDSATLTAALVSGPTHGSVTLNANGSFSYTPNLGYVGPDSFTYRANDGSLNSGTATVNITVRAVNHAPVANNDSYSVNEDTSLIVSSPGVLGNDTDSDGDPTSAVLVTGPTHGTLTLNPNGGFTYNPALNYNGADSFTYYATDGLSNSLPATVSITVNPVNDAPVGSNDTYSVNEDTTLTLNAPGVLANDSDVEGDTLTAILVSGPSHGSVSLNSDGSFTYTPAADYNGPDSFTYKPNDGTADGSVATVDITVNAVNDAPVAVDDAYSVNEDTTLTVLAASGVLTNDTDIDGNSLTAVLVAGTTNGTVSLNADGSFTYTPNTNFNGIDTFTYQANDGTVNGNTATVTITVNAQNDAPVAVDDNYSVNEDGTLNISAPGVLGNDTDIDSTNLTASVITNPTHGTLTLNADGSFTYTPDPNYNGPDSFTYQATDGSLNSATATANITVNAMNDAPVGTNDVYTLNEDATLTVPGPGVLANDGDIDGDTLTAVVGTLPTHGTLTLNPDGSFTYTPNPNYNGPDSFTYFPNDGATNGAPVTVNLTVTAVNDAPVANDDSYSVNEDTPLVVAAPGVLGNDTDVESDPLTATVVNNPAHGSLTLNTDGSFSYTPNANYNGADSFTYKINDGTVDGNTATVNITVNPVNDAPVANNDIYSVNEDTTLNISAPGVLVNDTDIENDPLTAILVAGPAHGSLTLNADGSFSYISASNYHGADSFTYKANDGSADSGVATVSITVNSVNDAPVAVDDNYSTAEDTVLTIAAPGVLTNDVDVDGDLMTAIVVSQPSHGSLNLNADGSFVYTPNTNYNGADSFTYKANDGTVDGNVATVNITVTAVNDAPVAVNDSYVTAEDTTLNVSASGVLGNDTDVEGDSLTAILVSGPAHGTLTLNANGSFSYTPALNYNGSDSFTYKANDGQTDGNTATVNITVTSVNDAPVAVDDNYTTVEDTVLTVAVPGVLTNDVDVDGDALTAVVVSQPSHGSLTLNADGSFIYTPNTNYNGADSFTYKANDGTTDGNVATVNITVTAVNDAPVAVNDTYIATEDSSLTVSAPGVLGNDTDVDDVTLTAELVSGPAHGTLTLNADGSFTYTPTLLYAGPDTFVYKAVDSATNTSTATVNITVGPVNHTPVANNDSYSVNEDTTLNVVAPGVLGNDNDIDGDTLSAILLSGPSHGSLTLNADGSFSYTPAANYNGPDSFTYSASDSVASNSATVNITVNPVNDSPVANNDIYSVNEDTTLNIATPGVLVNDTDVENDTLTAMIVAGPAHGSVTLNADGSFSYTPALNYNGPDSFTYKANDGSADSGVATVSITVNPVNDAPLSLNDSYSVNEDTTLNVSAPGVLGNDGDVEGDSLTAILVAGPTHGTLTLNANGSFTYTPALNYNGSDSFTYKANDGLLDGNTATVNITVNAVNDAPVAVDDNYSVNEDTTLNVAAPGVLTNDTDVDSTNLTASVVTGPSHGTLTLNSDGSFAYTPNTNYNGADSFTYQVSDSQTNSSTATVNITVSPVNDAPVANNDSYSVNEDTTLNISGPGVLVNDTDVENNALTAILVTGPAHGTLSLNADGSFGYTPASNYNGADSFTYKANDGSADSGVATVSITVNAVNDAPVANNDSYSVNEDTTLNISAPGVLSNDTDVDSPSLTASLIAGPSHGTLTLNADGSFTYTPSANYNGPDAFTYQASDGQTNSSTATVNITVIPVNDAPVANNDSYSVNEDTTLNISGPGVLVNDTDIESDPLAAILAVGPAHGTLTLNSDGSFSYTPALNYNGPDSFTYKANDGSADSGVATVSITVNAVNDAPLAINDNYSADEDITLTVPAPGVLGNDTDVDSTNLTASLVVGPTHGTLTLNSDGSFVYTPNTNYNGPDTFTYQASDSQTNSSTATVNIAVNPVNDAPVANNDNYSVNEDTTLNIAAPGVLGNDTDIENDPLTAVQEPFTGPLIGPFHGSLVLNSDGSFSYTPATNYHGPDSFKYRANDGSAISATPATVNITVNPVNDAPVANNDNYSVNEDTTLNISLPGVLANDTDVDLDPLTASVVTGPAHGSLTLSADGSFSYTPNANYNGPDSFVYQASDGSLSSSATVSINVTPVNDAPVAVNDNYTVLGDSVLNIAAPGVLGNDSDIDSAVLTATVVTGPSHGSLTLNADGSFTYTPTLLYNGPDSFTYQASDGSLSATATVNITVSPIDHAPVANNDSYSTAEDTTLNVSAAGVLANDTDVDNDTLTASIVSLPAHGTVTLNANGSFSYTPSANYNGPDTFTYKANDGLSNSAPATVNISVTPVNDAPLAVDDNYTINEDQPLNIAAPGVLTNDTDIENNPLTAVIIANPTNGTVTLNADGSFLYTPNTNYNGVDTFTYSANDGVTNGNTATVTITINPVNDAPVAVNDSYVVDEDNTLTVVAPGVLANDTDAETNALTATLVSGTTHGSLTLNTNGSFTYTPVANYNGPDSFTYQASDGQTNSSTATVNITVNPVNDAPVANDDFFTGNEDAQLSMSIATILSNDTDIDGDTLSIFVYTQPAHGTVAFNAGALVYTPATNYNGPDSFTYRATDGDLLSGSATVHITVLPVNDAPVAADDSYSTTEDTTLNVSAPGVLLNDSDVDNDPLSTVLVTGPAHGSLTLNPNGSFSYTPALNYNGADSFTYRASDGTAQSGVATVNLTISAVNDAPVANSDVYTTAEDTALTVNAAGGVLANDTDVDNDPLTAVLVAGPAHGSLTLNANGSFTYTPAANYNGPDSFTYQARDGSLNSSTATVNITVTPVDDAPVANNDNYSVNEDTTLTVASPGVLINDTDIENDPLTAILVSGPAHGSLTLNLNGSFSYTPSANYNGPDSFTYKANDGTVDGSIATVNITVTAVNDAPIANNDNYSINEDTTLTVAAPGVLVNDTDIDSVSLTASLIAGPAHGTLTLNSDGSFTYTPNTNYNGPDSFTYQASDSQTNSSTATVAITVNPVNDAPVSGNDNYNVNEDTTLNVSAPGVLLNDSDVDANPLTAILVAGPAHGTVTLNSDGSFSYTPTTNYNGPDAFTYKANDGTVDGNIATVSITVAPVNDAPVANNDNYNVNEDTTLTVVAPGVLLNDTDIDSASLTASLVAGPAHGTVTLNSDGSFSYTPAANFNGPDTFTYKANDGTVDGNIATVNITVGPVNDAPVAVNDIYSTAEDTALAGNVLVNDSDPDGDSLSAVIATQPAHGTVVLNSDGTFTYTPAHNYNGPDTFTYTASDGLLSSSPATVSITVTAVNDPPVANNDDYSVDSYTVIVNTILNVAAPGLLANDIDPDGNPLHVSSIVVGPTHGTISNLNTNGSFSYIPNPGFVGIDTFTYTANDGFLDSAPALVTITVVPNPIPVLLASGGAITFNTQNGLFEQRVTVTNAGSVSVPAFRVDVAGLRSNVFLYNASGTNAGVPYVHYNAPLDTNQSVSLLLKFYVADRKAFTNVLTAEPDTLTTTGTNGAAGVLITRGFVDNRGEAPRFVIEFSSIIGRTYVISYCDDMNSGVWKMATPSIVAGSNKTQWYDDGPPETESAPLSNQMRVYRATLVPSNP